MRLMELTRGQAQDIVKWLEDKTFINIVAPLLATEQDDATAQVLAELRNGNVSAAQDMGGYARGLSRLMLLHDEALQILQTPDQEE